MVDKSTVDGCLKGVSFPASKDEVGECASGNSCPQEVFSQLQDMHVTSYHSEDDVLCNLGNLTYC
jgi:hypothetical protein